MPKKKKIGILVALLAMTLMIAAVIIFVLPYMKAESEMAPGAVLTLQELEDGSLQLSWPAAERADHYLVEVLGEPEADSEEESEEFRTLHSQSVSDGTDCILPALPADEPLTIRVNTMVRYDFPGEDKFRPGEEAVQTTLYLNPPVIDQLQWTADPETDSIQVTFRMEEGDCARLYQLNQQGEGELLRTLMEGQATVYFGEHGDLPMLEHGEVSIMVLEPYREQPGSVYFGRKSELIQVIRENLLGTDLEASLVNRGENMCTLTWNETKGQEYQVQLLDEQTAEWITLHTVSQTGERSYTTDHLKAHHTYRFRVVAVGGITLPDSELAAVSRPLEFKTTEAVLYATIWPIKDLEVYSDPEMTEVIGKITGGSAHCVLDEVDGTFQIRMGDEQTGFVDSNYCMINLVDYLGELCSYNITNSYSSIYKIHNYSIKYVTGQVTAGYERVRMADGSYLVPLLYPTALKLREAALDAYDRGYRLKIYDSYRPNQATVQIYDRTESILEDPVPGNIPDPSDEDPDRLLTYEKVMTQDVYNLGYFLARGVSMHNLGIALDLTLENQDTGEEQAMQTAMHDLSCYSVLYRNNESANILAEVMKGAGFSDLISEWWHFQDDEIRKTVNLSALWAGVSPECWMADDHGWRYRYSDGSYAVDCTLTIGEGEYSFDSRGYLIESE